MPKHWLPCFLSKSEVAATPGLGFFVSIVVVVGDLTDFGRLVSDPYGGKGGGVIFTPTGIETSLPPASGSFSNHLGPPKTNRGAPSIAV